jgi:sigma-E factor negative regulatory protein RseB
MPRSKRFHFTVLLLAIPVLAIANDYSAVEAWLQKMHKAAHTLNYKGKFVYQQEKQLSLMRIIHSVGEDGERERLVALDETGREIIRNKNKITCILPDSKSVVVDKGRPVGQFPPAFPVRLDAMKNQYSFLLDKQERVAGQLAQKIVIQPNDNYRYGHRLWVDTQTGLLLKTHLVSETGDLVEQFMFTELEFLDTVPEELLMPSISGEHYTWYEAQIGDDEPEPAEHSVGTWAITRLPAGFNTDMQRRHKMPNKTAVEHHVFSDGLASVSVFIEQEQKNTANLMGASRMGAVNAYGKKVDSYHVTVVGEVPSATVRMIGDSVTQQK